MSLLKNVFLKDFYDFQELKKNCIEIDYTDVLLKKGLLYKEKIERKKLEISSSELDGCTFTPVINHEK